MKEEPTESLRGKQQDRLAAFVNVDSVAIRRQAAGSGALLYQQLALR